MNKKKYIFTVILCLVIRFTFGQTDSSECKSMVDTLTNQKVYIFVDKMPEPQGGSQELFKQLAHNVEFNGREKDVPINGSMTIVSFVINEDGRITDKQTVKEDFVGQKIPEQMFRVIESIKWIPGYCNGNPVKVKYTLPLRTCFTR